MLRPLLLLLVPAVAFAQTPELVAKVEAKLDAERAAQRAEDVEVFRRVLNKACGLPDKAQAMTRQFVAGTGSDRIKSVISKYPTAVGPFDGVYLPGAGAVFTLHVPAAGGVQADGNRVGLTQSCSTCHSGVEAGDTHHVSARVLSANNCYACHDGDVTPPKQLSEWERTKLDVRGEKPKADEKPKKEEKPKATVCEPGSLHTQIAGVLAANAKNLRHLGEKEGVTVVVTFDGLGEKPPTVWNVDPKALADVDVLAGPLPKEPKAVQPAFGADDQKQISLAGLNLKIGQYAAAVEAYGKVLGKFTEKEWKITAPELTPEQRNQYADEMQAQVRDAFKSYAKALLLADQPDKAKKALEMATEFVVLEVTVTTVPAKNTAPAKLILTLSKADGDAKEPKKLVKVERVNWPK